MSKKSLTLTGDRDHLLQIARTVRDCAAPRIQAMIDRLAVEAETAERDTARVTAARAVVSFAVESAKLVHEIETGETSGNGGPSVNILVAVPGAEPRAASADEARAALSAISDSVIAERAKR